jgi:hypothetical protein
VMSRLRDVWELSNGEIIIQVHKICSGVERLNESGIDEMDISTTDSVKRTAGSNDSKGLNIIKEIVDTEVTYILGLQEVVAVRVHVKTTHNGFTSTILLDLFLLHKNLMPSFGI